MDIIALKKETDSQKDIFENKKFNGSPYAMGIFLGTTLIHLIIKLWFGGKRILWDIIYILVVILGQFLINLYTVVQNCKKIDWELIITMTLGPWLGMLCVIFLLIMPGSPIGLDKIFLRPFANTFGYLGVIGTGGASKVLKGTNPNTDPGLLRRTDLNKHPGLREAIDNIQREPSIIINELTPYDFDNTYERLKYLFAEPNSIQSAEDIDKLKMKLKVLVNNRYTISSTIWYILTGLITISSSQAILSANNC